MEVKKEGMACLVGNQEHTLFGLHALDFIVLNDKLLLQNLDGIKLLGTLGFSKHNLTEVTLSEHSQEIEVVQSDLGLTDGCDLSRRSLCWDLLYLLLLCSRIWLALDRRE